MDLLKKIFLLFVAAFFVATLGVIMTPAPARAAEAQTIGNAGFARGNIIFSKEPFFAGDQVRIYTIIFNGSSEDLSGAVEFFADTVSLGKSDFSVKGGGTIRDVWIDWTATFGEHKITAKIVNAKASVAGGVVRSVVLDLAESGAVAVAVDKDTDGDSVGDKTDPDIDGDGLANAEEIKAGYNPLKKDSNGNGIDDKTEYEAAIKRAVADRNLATLIASGTAGVIQNVVEMVKNNLGTITTAAAGRYAGGAADFAESARKSAAVWAKGAAASLQKELDKDLATNVEIPSGDLSKIKTATKDLPSPERPIKYALMLATEALYFVLANKWLTYFVLSFTIYLILKVLYRWMR